MKLRSAVIVSDGRCSPRDITASKPWKTGRDAVVGLRAQRWSTQEIWGKHFSCPRSHKVLGINMTFKAYWPVWAWFGRCEPPKEPAGQRWTPPEEGEKIVKEPISQCDQLTVEMFPPDHPHCRAPHCTHVGMSVIPLKGT